MEGALACSDCHAPHGTRERASLRKTSIYVKQEACLNCHRRSEPWVSNTLARKKRDALSAMLPMVSQSFYAHPGDSDCCAPIHGHAFYATFNCVNCHNQIHGPISAADSCSKKEQTRRGEDEKISRDRLSLIFCISLFHLFPVARARPKTPANSRRIAVEWFPVEWRIELGYRFADIDGSHLDTKRRELMDG